MKKILLFVSLAISTIANAQTITFQKTYGGADGDVGSSVQQTSDGGYIIAGGYAGVAPDGGKGFLIKTNNHCDILWTKIFSIGGAGSVQQIAGGGYIIAGTKADVSGHGNLYVVKTNSNGDTVWSKSYNDMGIPMILQSTGGYVVGGTTYYPNDGILLIKIDTIGNILWEKTFGKNIGGDLGNGIKQTSDGGYIIVGWTNNFGAGDFDVYLIKTNANGDTIWTKTYGGTNFDYGSSVQQTLDGGYIVAGVTESFGAGSRDVYLIKIDSYGNLSWSKTYGGTSYDGGNSIIQTSDRGYIITGNTHSFGAGNDDVYLIKTDSIGDTLWTRSFGGFNDDFGISIQQTFDNGYIISGGTQSFGAGNNDVYLIKTDSSGNSNCNQHSTNTIISIPSTIVSNTSTNVLSGGITSYTSNIISNGGTLNTLCISTTQEEIPNTYSISIYPNPTSGKFTVTSNQQPVTSIVIYNLLGEKIYNSSVLRHLSSISIDISNQPKGIYFYKISSEGNNLQTGKLIIE